MRWRSCCAEYLSDMPRMLLLTMVDVSLGSFVSGCTLVGQRWNVRHNATMIHSMTDSRSREKEERKDGANGSCVVVAAVVAAGCDGNTRQVTPVSG